MKNLWLVLVVMSCLLGIAEGTARAQIVYPVEADVPFDFTVRHNQGWRNAYPLHENIVIAIRKRRPEAARKAVRQLLADTDKVLAQQARETSREKRLAK